MLISVYQTSSFLTPWIFLPLKVPKTCEMNKWQTVLLFFPPVSHTIILLPISFELHFGHHKDVTKDTASPSLHAAWGKAGLHTQSRLMRILLSMRSSGGSWAYSSIFTYILIFYPLKAKETHSICMCTCALFVCMCASNTVCVEVRGWLHRVCFLLPFLYGYWGANSGFRVCTTSTFTYWIISWPSKHLA